ncbi:MAG: sugar kinase [Parcubacteria group bacterium Gr01-1014_31]|nr:MAG: sugar kinase [Parcubacteria group bacterium Gr01-1014_31]
MSTVITRRHLRWPTRQPNSRKGDNGRVLIVGGSPEYSGAPALSGIAALRSGADSVVVAAPEKVAWAINGCSPDLVTRKLPGQFLSVRHFSELKKMASRADCLLLGGGVHPRPQSLSLLKRLAALPRCKVLDAAALDAFDPQSLRNAVLTPNRGEYLRLQRRCDLRALVAKGNIIVAKSWRTVIYSMRGRLQNRTGNPGLTKAGTGDVLAGFIAGLIAQSGDPLQASINAVYRLGRVGDALRKKYGGYYFLASDLAAALRDIRRGMVY